MSLAVTQYRFQIIPIFLGRSQIHSYPASFHQFVFFPDNALYLLRAIMVNETTAQTTLDISSELPRNVAAVLETHIAPVSIGGGDNSSDMWTVSSTKIDRLQPVIIEFITGFQDNGTYRVRVRLILKDPATGSDVVLPFSQTVFLAIAARSRLQRSF